MRVIFTPSELNFADPMTKNVTDSIHQELVPALKDGRIADTIFATVNREDVGKGLKSSTQTDRHHDVAVEEMMLPVRTGQLGPGVRNCATRGVRDRSRERVYSPNSIMETDTKEAGNRGRKHG